MPVPMVRGAVSNRSTERLHSKYFFSKLLQYADDLDVLYLDSVERWSMWSTSTQGMESFCSVSLLYSQRIGFLQLIPNSPTHSTQPIPTSENAFCFHLSSAIELSYVAHTISDKVQICSIVTTILNNSPDNAEELVTQLAHQIHSSNTASRTSPRRHTPLTVSELRHSIPMHQPRPPPTPPPAHQRPPLHSLTKKLQQLQQQTHQLRQLQQKRGDTMVSAPTVATQYLRPTTTAADATKPTTARKYSRATSGSTMTSSLRNEMPLVYSSVSPSLYTQVLPNMQSPSPTPTTSTPYLESLMKVKSLLINNKSRPHQQPSTGASSTVIQATLATAKQESVPFATEGNRKVTVPATVPTSAPTLSTAHKVLYLTQEDIEKANEEARVFVEELVKSTFAQAAQEHSSNGTDNHSSSTDGGNNSALRSTTNHIPNNKDSRTNNINGSHTNSNRVRSAVRSSNTSKKLPP